MTIIPRFRAVALLVAVTSACAPPALAQRARTADAARSGAGEKFITHELLQGRDRPDFDGAYARGLSWLDDDHYLEERRGRTERVHAVTGESSPLYDLAAVKDALAKAEGIGAEAESLAGRLRSFSDDRTWARFAHGETEWAYCFSAGRAVELFRRDGLREIGFSPRAGFVSYVRDNNVHVFDLAKGESRALTGDGSAMLLNGVLDWVYQEEVYGRGDWRAYWWSADDRYVAYLQLDERPVPAHTLIDHIAVPQRLETERYPHAGEPNPKVRLGIVPAGGGAPVWADLGQYGDEDILIVRVAWSPDHKVMFQVQDREQRWLDLNEADPESGRVRTLVREKSPAWVNVLDQPRWLSDGRFLWRSERDGYAHLYLYSRAGELLQRLTRGPWDVSSVHGADEKGGWVYFNGTRESAIQTHAYRARLDGEGAPQRLTEPGLSHAAVFNPSLTRFIDTFGNLHTPPKVRLLDADGTPTRWISENKTDALGEYTLGESRFLEIATPDNATLDAHLILPPDYQPGRRYPVVCKVYAGPASPTVSDRWRGTRYLGDQALATRGYIVWYCDPRSARGEGAVNAWHAYKRLGEAELADIETGVRWLIDEGYADPERVAIQGGSYGGYIVCYALTHSKMFKLGIAAYPVTDWRHYDSIYTERYMQTPQNNPEGYKRSSALEAADDLHGRLLIYHGMMDDNVHLHNTLLFIDRLQRAGKQFDLMLYPLDRHGIGRGGAHEREMALNYLLNNL